MIRNDYQRLYYHRHASPRADRLQREREAELLDAYGVATYQDPVQTPEEILLAKEGQRWLSNHIDQIKYPRSTLAIRMHYGIGCEPHTLDQIGDRFNVSKERVRQIIGKGMRSMRRHMLIDLKPDQYWTARHEAEKSYRAEREKMIAKEIDHERTMEQRRLRELDEAWEREHHPVEDAAAAAARWARAKEQQKVLDEKRRVTDLERWKQDQQDLFDHLHAEAHYVNSLWDKELLRREIVAEQARELEAKRNSQPKRRDWLYVASDRKQA